MQTVARPFAFTLVSVGRSSEAMIAMMAIVTSNSINVKARFMSERAGSFGVEESPVAKAARADAGFRKTERFGGGFENRAAHQDDVGATAGESRKLFAL